MQIEMESFTTLSEIAKKLKLNKTQLFYYEHLGLITPVTVVGEKKMRIYNMEDVVGRICFIEKNKKKFSLSEIKQQLDKS